MTRTETATKLLALGPLTPRQFREITGWPYQSCRRTLSWLAQTHRVRRDAGGTWRLAA